MIETEEYTLREFISITVAFSIGFAVLYAVVMLVQHLVGV